MTGALVLRCTTRFVALPLESVSEVFRMAAMAVRLARAPRNCLGAVDHHGQLVPVFDLSALLRLSRPRVEEELIDGHVVLVADSLGQVGYAADEVTELVMEAPQPLPPSSDRLTTHAVRTSAGALAPMFEARALLTVLTREQVRRALAQLDGARP